jgi:hypothetical protein
VCLYSVGTVTHRLGCRRLLSVLLGILSAGTVEVGCSRQTGDKMAQRHLSDIAGKEAADCGHVGLHQSPGAANDCAIAAWKIHHAFFVRYDVQGLDSELVVGLASGNSGDVFSVKYDSTGWETHGLRSGVKVLDNSHILVTPCPSPIKLFASDGGYLSCY